jgi:hypothetical protein
MVHPDGRRECYDADYRRWHASYWGQNTRLIYWPLLAAGDFEGMRAYFRFHLEILPAAMHRGGLALRDKSGPGKSGAFYWETMPSTTTSRCASSRKKAPASTISRAAWKC